MAKVKKFLKELKSIINKYDIPLDSPVFCKNNHDKKKQVRSMYYTLDDYDDYGWMLECKDKKGAIDITDLDEEVEKFKPKKKKLLPYISDPFTVGNLVYVLENTFIPDDDTIEINFGDNDFGFLEDYLDGYKLKWKDDALIIHDAVYADENRRKREQEDKKLENQASLYGFIANPDDDKKFIGIEVQKWYNMSRDDKSRLSAFFRDIVRLRPIMDRVMSTGKSEAAILESGPYNLIMIYFYAYNFIYKDSDYSIEYAWGRYITVNGIERETMIISRKSKRRK